MILSARAGAPPDAEALAGRSPSGSGLTSLWVPVTIVAVVGRYRQIQGDGIEVGVPVVERGVHYCFDGAKVAVTAAETTE